MDLKSEDYILPEPVHAILLSLEAHREHQGGEHIGTFCGASTCPRNYEYDLTYLFIHEVSPP